jgi:hypothetical protein
MIPDKKKLKKSSSKESGTSSCLPWMSLYGHGGAQCKMLAQNHPQRKLLLSIIFDPMHRFSSNMTQNVRKNNAQFSIKKNATACKMHDRMHNA